MRDSYESTDMGCFGTSWRILRYGISPQGNGVISSYMPDLNAPGAVKTGEVELIAGVALKNTLKAAVLKDIPIGA